MKTRLKVKMDKSELSEADLAQREVMFGGMRNPPSWETYIKSCIRPGRRRHSRLMKKWLLKKPRILCGDEVNNISFRFSDGVIIAFTCRGWGDFAQAVVDKREGYMKYYMEGW